MAMLIIFVKFKHYIEEKIVKMTMACISTILTFLVTKYTFIELVIYENKASPESCRKF